MNRHCPKCDTIKPITEFGKQPRQKDGLQTYCKACCLIENRKSKMRSGETQYHRDGYMTEDDHFNAALRLYSQVFNMPQLLNHLTNTGSIQRYDKNANPIT